MSASSTPLLSIQNLTVHSRDQRLVAIDHLDIGKGEVVGILGPNGAGKSSFLKALMGLIPHQGQITVADVDMTLQSAAQRATMLSYLPQSPDFAWSLQVSALLDIAAQQFGLTRHSQVFHDVIDQLDLSHLLERNIDTLSGGERARVHMARVLLQDTPLILLDEPLASLDPKHQLDMCDLLHTLADRGKTVVLVIHDLPLAYRTIDSGLLFDRGALVTSGKWHDVMTLQHLQKVFDVAVQCDDKSRQLSYAPLTCA